MNLIIGNAFKMAYAQQRDRQPTFHELIEAQVAEQQAKFREIEKQAQVGRQHKNRCSKSSSKASCMIIFPCPSDKAFYIHAHIPTRKVGLRTLKTTEKGELVPVREGRKKKGGGGLDWEKAF